MASYKLLHVQDRTNHYNVVTSDWVRTLLRLRDDRQTSITMMIDITEKEAKDLMLMGEWGKRCDGLYYVVTK